MPLGLLTAMRLIKIILKQKADTALSEAQVLFGELSQSQTNLTAESYKACKCKMFVCTPIHLPRILKKLLLRLL